MSDKTTKTDEEWRAQLSPDAYYVCRQKGTERPFSGKYNDCKDPGIYRCVCCGNELFSSDTKFDSGTGWPSYWEPLDPGKVALEEDNSLFMTRTEVMCAQCDAHLGHLFEDGPAPTHQRYCMNSVSLDLVDKESGE